MCPLRLRAISRKWRPVCFCAFAPWIRTSLPIHQAPFMSTVSLTEQDCCSHSWMALLTTPHKVANSLVWCLETLFQLVSHVYDSTCNSNIPLPSPCAGKSSHSPCARKGNGCASAAGCNCRRRMRDGKCRNNR